MNRTHHANRANLAVGAALLGCALVATERADAQNMLYTTVTSLTLNGSGTYAATPGSVTLPGTNWTGSAAYLDGTETYTSTAISGGWVTTYFKAYNAGYDFLGAYLTSAFLTDWTLSGSFGVTVSQAVTVTIFNGANWLINGSALSDGDTIAAGTYNITWSYAGNHSFLITGLGFAAASPAVPLPGAATLAACSLLGVTRRRRR